MHMYKKQYCKGAILSHFGTCETWSTKEVLQPFQVVKFDSSTFTPVYFMLRHGILPGNGYKRTRFHGGIMFTSQVTGQPSHGYKTPFADQVTYIIP